MDGGTRLRLHRSGMTHIIHVLHAVAESANIRHVVASQRRFLALSPCGGCGGGLVQLGPAIFRQAVCANAESDGDGWMVSCCVLHAIRTGVRRALDGVAVRRSGVAPKMTLFGSPRTVGRSERTC